MEILNVKLYDVFKEYNMSLSKEDRDYVVKTLLERGLIEVFTHYIFKLNALCAVDYEIEEDENGQSKMVYYYNTENGRYREDAWNRHLSEFPYVKYVYYSNMGDRYPQWEDIVFVEKDGEVLLDLNQLYFDVDFYYVNCVSFYLKNDISFPKRIEEEEE